MYKYNKSIVEKMTKKELIEYIIKLENIILENENHTNQLFKEINYKKKNENKKVL
jgi:hypothetical protein